MSDYIQKLQDIGEKIHAKTGVEFHLVSYSGGVPGMTTKDKIPFDRYNELLVKLTELFGEPNKREPWHPHHTKGVPPMEWKFSNKMATNEPYHAQLISMMQKTGSRYLIISFM